MRNLFVAKIRIVNATALTWAIAFAVSILFSASLLAQNSDHTAVIQGFVRNTAGVGVSGARVSLQSESGIVLQTTSSDPHGRFRFVQVSPGRYAVHLEMNGFEEASTDVFAAPDEQKNIALTLKPQTKSMSKPSPMPEFSNEPNFVVAGVTDTTNLGGHGSDVVARNRTALAKAAVSLEPSSAPSSNAASSSTLLEQPLLDDIQKNPQDYAANFRLGKLLVAQGKAREAIPYLETASRIKPISYETEYELACAHYAIGDYAIAAEETSSLLARQDKAVLHHLLAEIEEKRNHPVAAERQYQRATDLDPSEANFFDWGTELLLHQAPEPAIEVLGKGYRLFPGSLRMLTALGAAWYSKGSSDQAVRLLCQASDLDPNADSPYLFLGMIQNADAEQNPEVTAKLERFARLQSTNAFANYYYAVSLWKGHSASPDSSDVTKIESLLKAAIAADPKFSRAYLQLGNIYSEQGNSAAAIAAYQKAAESAPEWPDAHYRLAQAYRRAGDKVKAQHEVDLYEETAKNSTEERERQKHEIQSFVYTMRARNQASAPE